MLAATNVAFTARLKAFALVTDAGAETLDVNDFKNERMDVIVTIEVIEDKTDRVVDLVASEVGVVAANIERMLGTTRVKFNTEEMLLLKLLATD